MQWTFSLVGKAKDMGFITSDMAVVQIKEKVRKFDRENFLLAGYLEGVRSIFDASRLGTNSSGLHTGSPE